MILKENAVIVAQEILHSLPKHSVSNNSQLITNVSNVRKKNAADIIIKKRSIKGI